MKKHLLNKTLLRKLEGKKHGKARLTLEKKVRTTLTEQTRKLVKDLHTAEMELSAMRAPPAIGFGSRTFGKRDI
jgi:hypothetical protein